MKTAPKNRPIVLWTKGGSVVLADWTSIDDDTDSWVAVNEGEHPPSWDEGTCWKFNSDDEPSDPPIAWMEPPQ